jgi:tetratricopeptide (TPR) repeat protein
LDLIKVTKYVPLFSAEEANRVIRDAEAEGVDKNEYRSGKYQLGGDWLVNLPNTRQWFNKRLESTFFPLLAHFFPEVISSQSVLRAHSVSLLKYNSSHPRTDVHIDNGILAMTIAMTPQDQYVGGGTFFEHMGVENVVPMDVGHGTFRPGSVRHGGHRVTAGTRYILGAFLLLDDKVEHVRRLKNKGSEIRRTNDLERASQYFEWALALNPKCTTCLKDWAEILHTQKRHAEAEEKIRHALELLENKDSDALFTLGVLLSAQGRDDESIEAYEASVKLNVEDAELCYNLGIKLGAKGKVKEEMEMYARAVQVDPNLGGAWLNWGTAYAESGHLEDVSDNKGSSVVAVRMKLICILAIRPNPCF